MNTRMKRLHKRRRQWRLTERGDWSWLALGPLLGCAAVTVGPPVVRVVVAALRRKGERL